jgi:hypothetical protein
MHRGFFAQAIEDKPIDPMGSRYAPSVLAAYTSACSFVGLIESLYKQHPALTERMWFLFTHVFSCAVSISALPSVLCICEINISTSDCAWFNCSETSDGPSAICPLTPRVRLQPIQRGVRQSAESEDFGQLTTLLVSPV